MFLKLKGAEHRPLWNPWVTWACPDWLTVSVPPQTVSKYNSQYHKLFQTVPKEEILMKGDCSGAPFPLLSAASVQSSLLLC